MNSPVTKEFFATVQNKLHYAVTHHTAAEIVYGRADSTKPNMGLTTWKNAPQGRIRKSDVSIAKNYLNKEEMINLNEIVTMYLDYAERQARRGNIMYMQDWGSKFCGILDLGGWNVPDEEMETLLKIIDILKPGDKRKRDFRYKRVFLPMIKNDKGGADYGRSEADC